MSGQEGYATLTVSALMGALSLLAIGYTNLSIAEARKVDAVREQVELDVALDGAFYDVLNDLLQRRMPIVGEAVRSMEYGGESFGLRLQIENSKVDVNRERLPRINAALVGVFPKTNADAIARAVAGRRENSETAFATMQEFENLANSPAMLACLRDRFTLFRSTALTGGSSSEEGLYAEDGMIIRMQIVYDDGMTYRALDAVVLMTGRPLDPFWVLDWQRRGAQEIGGCDAIE